MRLASGHLAVPLSGEELARQKRAFEGYNSGMVRLTPGGWLFPGGFTKFADGLYNYQFRDTDVLVMTHPKCGTTWTQEIVWTMRNNPDLDHPRTSESIDNCSPFIEFSMLEETAKPGKGTSERMMRFLKKLDPEAEPERDISLQLTSLTPDPRTIKTHLPLSLLTPHLLDTAKVVYVARNPKDVCVSFYHHSRIMKGSNFVGTQDEFVQFMVDDDLIFGPYWEHLQEAWTVRDHPNMHFIFYEDLKADTMTELDKLNTFLGTSLTTTQLQQVAHHTSFGQMKAREEATKSPDYGTSRIMEVVEKDGGFFRKGEAGSWKKQLTATQIEKFELWTKKNIPKLGPSFKYSM